MPQRRKIYCYVDETGQDAASAVFVVVAVTSAGEQDKIRRALIEIEEAAGTGRRKWHKTKPERRLAYLHMVLKEGVVPDGIFYGSYEKPLPYFFPFLEVIEYAVKSIVGTEEYLTRIFVDGIDRQKAKELTNALRLRGVSLELVKGRRDESEPLIRLADMWAGCIRGAIKGKALEREVLARATKDQRVKQLDSSSRKAKTP